MNTRIIYLLEQHLKGTLPAEDHRELYEWFQSVDAAGFQQVIEVVADVHPSLIQFNSVPAVMLEQLEKNIDALTLSETLPHIRWKYWVAAASLIFIVGLVTYFWSARRHTSETEQQPGVVNTMQNNMAPGGDRAVLTLADGSRLVLDSASNGVLGNQGVSEVIKTAEGALLYKPAKQDSRNKQPLLYNTLSTPRGGTYRLTLPDGSLVWLNAESSITYPAVFSANERKVSVTGEAYFEIEKDALKPFKVYSGEQQIEVLGTSFNVNVYADELTKKTTLLSGSIKIKTPKEEVTLQSNQQAQIINSSLLIIHSPPDAIAWKNGLFQFNSADIQTIMRQISRWYNVEIVYKGAVPERKFTGKIQRSLYLKDVLEYLEQSNVHFKLEGKQLSVYP